jgi:NAD(P)-dependent dehydrogenase (short-subunit alcohol dehydrogenase family)
MFYQSCVQKKSNPDEVLLIDASMRYTVCDGSTTGESFDTGDSCMQLAGSVAVITGGASGLGAATARLFAGAGAKLALWDLNAEAGNALAAEFGSNGLFVKTDVTSSDDVQRALTQVQEQFGSVRIVINCAGIATAERVIGRQGPLPLERFEWVIQINLIGTFNVIRLAAALMMQNTLNAEGERGVIINTASVAAFEGQIGQPAYAASKAGVAGMTLPIAREFAAHGIRVVAIAPGVFDTPMVAGLSEPARQALSAAVPFPKRLGRPEEYAALARHIVENVMLNGETIRLDGALRMGPR